MNYIRAIYARVSKFGFVCSSMQRVAYIAGIELTCFRSERFRAASTGLMSASSNAIMIFFGVSNIVIGNGNAPNELSMA